MTPSVSVVMPVYNCERYVEEAIVSILAQTFKDFELIVIDDGSSDGTSKILARLARSDKRINAMKNPRNLGMTATMNRGLREARGELIARMDADDIALKDRLARQVEFLRKHPKVMLVGTAAWIVDKNGKKIGELTYASDHATIVRRMPYRNQFIHPSTMFRKVLCETVGVYDERFRVAQDYDFFARISRRHPTANLKQKLLKYRWDFAQNAGFTSGKRQEREALQVRWRMISSYGWGWSSSVALIRPALSFLVPMSWKRWILSRINI